MTADEILDKLLAADFQVLADLVERPSPRYIRPTPLGWFAGKEMP